MDDDSKRNSSDYKMIYLVNDYYGISLKGNLITFITSDYSLNGNIQGLSICTKNLT